MAIASRKLPQSADLEARLGSLLRVPVTARAQLLAGHAAAFATPTRETESRKARVMNMAVRVCRILMVE